MGVKLRRNNKENHVALGLNGRPIKDQLHEIKLCLIKQNWDKLVCDCVRKMILKRTKLYYKLCLKCYNVEKFRIEKN